MLKLNKIIRKEGIKETSFWKKKQFCNGFNKLLVSCKAAKIEERKLTAPFFFIFPVVWRHRDLLRSLEEQTLRKEQNLFRSDLNFSFKSQKISILSDPEILSEKQETIFAKILWKRAKVRSLLVSASVSTSVSLFVSVLFSASASFQFSVSTLACVSEKIIQRVTSWQGWSTFLKWHDIWRPAAFSRNTRDSDFAKMTFYVGRIFRNLLILILATARPIDTSAVQPRLDYSVIQATGKFCPNRDTCQTTGRQNRGPEGIENDWKKRNCFCDDQVIIKPCLGPNLFPRKAHLHC